MTVGGESFVNLTAKSVDELAEELIFKAKDGDQSRLSIQLRKYGYLNEHEVVKEASNEIIALIEAQVAISKIQNSNNKEHLDTLLRSENFTLKLGKNTFDEEVFTVAANDIERTKHQIKILTSKIETKTKSIDQLKRDLDTLINSISQLENMQLSEEQISELNYKKQKEHWESELNSKGYYRTTIKSIVPKKGIYHSNIFLLGVGFILEVQHPASPSNIDGFHDRHKKLNDLTNKGGMKDLRAKIKKLNAELFRIEKITEEEVKKLKPLQEKYKEQHRKQSNSIFGFGKSSVYQIEREYKELASKILNKRTNALIDVFYQSSLFSHEQSKNAADLYQKSPMVPVPISQVNSMLHFLF